MSEPLVRLLKRVRESHGVKLARLEECMHLPQGTYRHIERGRRRLPDFRQDLVPWIQSFENCVGATPEERKAILEKLSRQILDQFDVLLRDVQNGT